MIALMVQLKDTSGTIVLFETIGGPPKSNHQEREYLSLQIILMSKLQTVLNLFFFLCLLLWLGLSFATVIVSCVSGVSSLDEHFVLLEKTPS